MIIVEGIPSGDHECFCLLVTREDFKRLEGHDPDEEFDVGPFAKEGSPYRYKLYPRTFLGLDLEDKGRPFTFKIDVSKGEGGTEG